LSGQKIVEPEERKERADVIEVPLLMHKSYAEESVFKPEHLMREARRQKGLAEAKVPSICILDPDGDIVRWLTRSGRAERDAHWACYHTALYRFPLRDMQLGIVGNAVGASFAVLIAEELFASGCELVLSVTSAGQIVPLADPPYFVLIEKALRDEGTSYHYLPPAMYSHVPAELAPVLDQVAAHKSVYRGVTWTTDAPFRETASAIEHCRALSILGVEMEAAALYAFAQARRKSVICLAHITNTMARRDGDFETGAAGGSEEALEMIDLVIQAWLSTRTRR
jgi:uridine phosphorylase